MSMFGSPATDATLEDRVAQLEAAIASLTGTVDGNAGSVAQAIDAVAQQRLAGDDAALAAVNDAVAGSVERSEQVDTRLGAEIVTRAQETDHLNQRVDGLLGEVDTRVGVAEFYAERAALSEANVAAMATQPTNAAQLWETVGVVRGLSSLVGAFDGQRGEVAIGDGGSHTDPVTGLTVQNAGVYQWVASSSKWTWVSEGDPATILADRTAGTYQIGVLPFDSSAITDADGDRIGLSFAVGQNGDNAGSDSDAVFKVTDYIGLSKIHAGARVRCRVEYELSETFSPTITPFLQLRRAGQLVNLINAPVPSTTEYTIVQNERVGNIRYVALDFIATGTEDQAGPFIRFSGSNSLGGETIIYLGHRFSLVSRTDNSIALQSQQLGGAIRSAALAGSDSAYARALSPVPVAISTLGAAGYDYSDYREAYTDVGAGELTARKEIILEPGRYYHDAAQPGDVSYILPRYTDFRGGDAPHRSVVYYFQPDNVDPSLTSTNEPMRNWYTSSHFNYRVETKNTRYTVHADPGTSEPDQTLEWEGMQVIHYGNQGAVDYQTSLGGSGNPGGVWSLARAFGEGGSSGWKLDHRDCYFQSYKHVFGYHDNIDFDKPTYVDISDTPLVATSPEDQVYAYRFGVLGSGVASKLHFRGVSTNGDMQIEFGPWLSEDPDNQPADPSWQFQIRTQAHDPMKVETSGAMRALKIASTSTASGSSIDVSGSTQALLDAWFGDVYARPGSGGMAGYVFGYNNVNAATVGAGAVQINSLGKRAGNRTSSPWVLSVAVNGGAPIAITFNTDLTNVSNTTIINTINAALGSAAVASEYNLIERYRPHFAGEESPRLNSSAVALPWKSWVAADTSVRKVRLMTATDSPSRSAGSVYGRLTNDYGDDIYPGGTGRVKHGGYWGPNDIIINGAPALAYGDLLEIDPANPGQLIKNNASNRPVLRYAGAGIFTRPTDAEMLDRTRALNYSPVTVDGDVAVIADPVSGRMPWWIDAKGRLFTDALDRGGNPYLTWHNRPTVDGDAASFYDPQSGRVPWWIDGHGRLHADLRTLDGAALTPLDQFTRAVSGLRYDGETVDGDAVLVMSADQRLPVWVDGRGRLRGDVSDRVGNAYLTALTAPYGQRAIYAPDRLRQAASRLRSIKTGTSSVAVTFAMIGDSWTGTSLYWIRAFTEYMQAEYGDGGPGWTAFAFSSSGSIAGCARADVTVTKSGSWVSNYFTGGSADAGQVTSGTQGDKYTITLAGPAVVTDAILHASSGTLRYRWNGGAWTEIAISGDALQTFALAGVPATSWTLEIEVVSGLVKMSGIDLQKSGGGVRVHKLGKNGSNTAHWTSVPEADFITGMAALAPHVVQIMHLTNDQILSGQAPVSPTQHAANVSELIRRARIAAPVADMLLVSPPSVRSQGSPQTAYAVADRGVAIAQACAHLDLQYAFGERYDDYAYGTARALLDSTLIHPTQTFGRATILDALVRTLTTAT